MRLSGKRAIVTGGGSGFGAGIARKFAAEGADVIVVDINPDAAQAMADRVAEELGTPLGSVVGYQVRFREKLGKDGIINEF